MTYVIFTIVMAIVAWLGAKCAGHRKHHSQTHLRSSADSNPGWDGRVERRASKRMAGALYHKPDGNWMFR